MSYTDQYITAEQAVQLVKSGDRVFIHGSAATPVLPGKSITGRYQELKEVELVSITILAILILTTRCTGKLFLQFFVCVCQYQGRGQQQRWRLCAHFP